MTFVFVLVTALMVAIALALVLTPLLRHARAAATGLASARLRALDAALAADVIDADEYALKRDALAAAPAAAGTVSAPAPRSRHALVAAVAVALLLPAGTLLLYRLVGAPQALNPAVVAATGTPADHGPGMQQAIAELAAKLEQQPNDIDGWSLLGRAYQTTERFAEARDAFRHALDLAPKDPDLMIEYAQAMALATPTHRLAGPARDLIERALKIAPQNQRGLWLLGISDYQDGNYPAAIASWNRLLPQLPKDSDLARSVENQIADARKLLGGASAPPVAVAGSDVPPAAAAAMPASAGADAGTSGADAAGAPKLTVTVALDPKLKDRLDPQATLFVYAKAASGPPMPLAIQRMSAGKLPITVTLDDSMGMLPSLKLSMFPQIVIGARISKSGNALAQSGDLQTLSAPLDVHRTEPVALTIDQVVP
ncbi:MAG TPA: c-type cytochrome biogenesis protein CcmI [Rhodanobacteraceae bacterium]|nr:c-type cytochrome biogenesis protein CcmI [Rhodanobacteraceae bacterium]